MDCLHILAQSGRPCRDRGSTRAQPPPCRSGGSRVGCGSATRARSHRRRIENLAPTREHAAMPALSLRQPRTRDAGPVDPAIAAGRARPSPLILFGAFDRHNLGDLLLGRIAGALAEASAPGRPLLFAGAASRDLREAGGEQVHGLDALIEHWQRESAHDPQRLPPDLLQAGGEILGCTAWEAAVMLETPDHAAALIRAHDRDLAGRKAWARLRARLAAPADCIVAASTSLLELCALLAGCTLCLASSLTCAHRRRSLRPPCGESRPGLRARTGRQAARLPRDLAWRLASPPPPRGGERDRGSGRGAGRARACTSCPRGRAGRTRRNCVPALPRRAHPQLKRTGSNPEDLWPSTDLQVPGM